MEGGDSGRKAKTEYHRGDVGGPPRVWIDPHRAYTNCEVSPEEYDEALAAARKDLLAGKRPVGPRKTPHLLITIGAPGAGKSSVAGEVARAAGNGDYVVIDFDVAVRYHPRYQNLWRAQSAVTERTVDVGYTFSYLNCNEALIGILVRLFYDILAGVDGHRYNIVLQSHSQVQILHAKQEGYRVSLLFVGVPLAEARARAKLRAVETGKFLAPTLAVQDEVVQSMWVEYRNFAVWYGLWADEFLVVDNRQELQKALNTLKRFTLQGAGWEKARQRAQAAVDRACT